VRELFSAMAYLKNEYYSIHPIATPLSSQERGRGEVIYTPLQMKKG
jgi:hypothetical protein